MDKEQRRRMAYRTIVQHDAEQGNIEYTVQVSDERVEIHRNHDAEWEDEDGTGPDVQHEEWVMSKETLKRLIKAAQWCIQKSEAFEAAHPRIPDLVLEQEERIGTTEDARYEEM